MQGTAADIIKRAMIELDKEIQSGKLDMRMIMQVHDELDFEIKESQVNAAIKLSKEKMESAAELAVPLVVDVGIGNNWDEAH